MDGSERHPPPEIRIYRETSFLVDSSPSLAGSLRRQVRTMAARLIALLALVAGALYWIYQKVVFWRFEQHKDVPRPPVSLLWGHLNLLGKAMGDLRDSRMHIGD